MKQIFLPLALVLLSLSIFAQAWNTSGNSGLTTNNILGTDNTNNVSIRFWTHGTERVHINESGTTFTGIGGSAPTPGFVGIGVSPTDIRSRLTITGENNSGAFPGGGFREWMKTGVFTLEHSDNMYVGMKEEDSTDRSDAVIAWSDNASGTGAIDKLRFIFTGSANIGGNNSNPRSIASFNGYEFMRMTPFPGLTNSAGSPVGNIGIGPVFNDNNLPQNRLHINAEDNLQTFLQISNELGTGQDSTDGLHIGYPTTGGTNLEVQINQRENDRLSLYSNNGERIRITQIGALNNGIAFNPGSLANNLTRIGISHNPATPVTRPLSLLHLGYNVSNATSNDGWRSWMDVGMFASQNSDHVYLGLDTASNGADAVLAWGDNSYPDAAGPDNFKMVFTTPLGGIAIPSASADGVEALRMTPTTLQGIFTGIGGDPAANPYYGSSTNPTATLEVNAWGNTNGNSGLRFTDLNSGATPATNPGAGVLAVNGSGDVIYVEANNAPAIGNYCGSTPAPLTNHYEIPLNDKTYYFTGQGTNPDVNNIGSSVAIGLNCGDPVPLAKLHVLQSVANPYYYGGLSTAGYFENNTSGSSAVGVFGVTYGDNIMNIGGRFEAQGKYQPQHRAIGVWGIAREGLDANAGVRGEGYGGDYNYGVYGIADSGTNNYAIYGESPGTYGNGWAGYFVGDVLSTTGNYLTSDLKLKSNIQDLSSNNALSLISGLNPKSYEYKRKDYPSMNLPKGRQYGLVAQEVETILPQLVRDAVHPADRDSQGNIIHPEVIYKAVNYTGFIPILIGAVKEQQHTIDSLKGVINDRLTSLENLLNMCCTNSHSYKTDPNDANTGSPSRQTVELSNPQTIILDQNVPNPFAEQTVIGYFLPDEVQSATIIFYNAEGKQINAAEITTRGKGEINVYAHDLSSGIYSYTLIADGKIIDTKRMAKR